MGYYDLMGYQDVELMGEDLELLGEDDYEGAMDLLGISDDDMDLIGARRARRARRPNPRQAMARAAASQRMARSSVVAKVDKPTVGRKLILPVTAAALTAPAGTTIITVQPSQPFKVEDFLIDPVIAVNFVINSIQVGRQNQFIGAGAVPATAFSALNPRGYVQFDTGQTSEQIQVSVTNTSLANSTFTAMFVGVTIN